MTWQSPFDILWIMCLHKSSALPGTEYSTGRVGWMTHRKWKEIKQQLSMLPGPAVPGSCLVAFYFRWAIHPIRPVETAYKVTSYKVKSLIKYIN